jgi:hypothetical protein
VILTPGTWPPRAARISPGHWTLQAFNDVTAELRWNADALERREIGWTLVAPTGSRDSLVLPMPLAAYRSSRGVLELAVASAPPSLDGLDPFVIRAELHEPLVRACLGTTVAAVEWARTEVARLIRQHRFSPEV